MEAPLTHAKPQLLRGWMSQVTLGDGMDIIFTYENVLMKYFTNEKFRHIFAYKD